MERRLPCSAWMTTHTGIAGDGPTFDEAGRDLDRLAVQVLDSAEPTRDDERVSAGPSRVVS